MNGAVEVDEGRVAVRFGVVEDALDARLFGRVVYRRFIQGGFPVCEGELDSLRAILEFGAEDGGLSCFPSGVGCVKGQFNGEEV